MQSEVPISPCGLGVDLLRRCYEADVRFFKDSDETTRIKWYWCKPGTKPIPYYTIFASGAHARSKFSWPGQGEVFNPQWEAKDGRNSHAPTTDHVCGTPEQWAGELYVRDKRPQQVDVWGWPMCCGDPAQIPAGPSLLEPLAQLEGCIDAILLGEETAEDLAQLEGCIDVVVTLDDAVQTPCCPGVWIPTTLRCWIDVATGDYAPLAGTSQDLVWDATQEFWQVTEEVHNPCEGGGTYSIDRFRCDGEHWRLEAFGCASFSSVASSEQCEPFSVSGSVSSVIYGDLAWHVGPVPLVVSNLSVLGEMVMGDNVLGE